MPKNNKVDVLRAKRLIPAGLPTEGALDRPARTVQGGPEVSAPRV